MVGVRGQDAARRDPTREGALARRLLLPRVVMLELHVRWAVAILLCSFGCASADADDPGGSSDVSGEIAESSGSSPSSGADSSSTSSDLDPADVTYWADVKPIVDARCGGCHVEGGVAPFALTTYDEVRPYGEGIAIAVESGQMPPWPAGPECNTYAHDPSLTAEQIETIRAWVDLDRPEGDPVDEGAALPSTALELPRIDLTAQMAEPHVPVAEDAGGYDEHRCFLVDFPADETLFLRGYAVRPSNRAAAHHLVVRIVGPDDVAELESRDAMDDAYGWPCDAGTGMSGGGGALLGAWVPGGGASIFPEGTGLRMPAGAKLLLNMHYNLVMGDDSPDQTAIDFMVESSVEREGQSVFVLDPTWPIGDNMLIPAGDPSVVHEADFGTALLGGAVDVYSVGMHIHTLATSGSVTIERANGDDDCLVDIPKWDFGWQLFYELQSGVRIESGDRLWLRCEWDNSAGNQQVIDGEPRTPVDVTWGEDTFDEMCMAILYAVPAG
jgi:hypothetical protein